MPTCVAELFSTRETVLMDKSVAAAMSLSVVIDNVHPLEVANMVTVIQINRKRLWFDNSPQLSIFLPR